MDAVILTGYFGSYSVDTPELAEREATVVAQMAGAAARAGKPLLVHSMVAEGPAIDAMWVEGLRASHSARASSSSVGSPPQIDSMWPG